MIRLPPDAEIIVNRLGEPPCDECFTVPVICTPRVEVEANWDTVRLYQIWAAALHRTGQRSQGVAVRSAPHVRGDRGWVGKLNPG